MAVGKGRELGVSPIFARLQKMPKSMLPWQLPECFLHKHRAGMQNAEGKPTST